jgi:hypothetical protein
MPFINTLSLIDSFATPFSFFITAFNIAEFHWLFIAATPLAASHFRQYYADYFRCFHATAFAINIAIDVIDTPLHATLLPLAGQIIFDGHYAID